MPLEASVWSASGATPWVASFGGYRARNPAPKFGLIWRKFPGDSPKRKWSDVHFWDMSSWRAI